MRKGNGFRRLSTSRDPNSMNSIAALGAVMECASPECITTLALFVLYAFLRYYRALKFIAADLLEIDESLTALSRTKSDQSVKSFVTKPKLRQSVPNGKTEEIDKSAVPAAASSPESEETPFDYHHSMSLLEKKSSLELESTPSERRRFLLACKGNVRDTIKRLNHYLRWNNRHVKVKDVNLISIRPTSDRDYDVWVEACLIAMKICGEVENIVLPRIIRILCREEGRSSSSNGIGHRDHRKSNYLDREGHRTFCIRPALMDIKLAKATTYTLAVAIYLDRSIDRETLEKVTVCVDVRAGFGWPNPHVLSLLPFIKDALKILLSLFPERLHKALLYPVPVAFLYVWRMISRYIDPLTVKRVCVLEGICKIEARPPTEELMMHFGEEELEQLEAFRINNFR